MPFRDDLIAFLQAHGAGTPPPIGQRPRVAPELQSFLSEEPTLCVFGPGYRRLGRQVSQANIGALAQWITERAVDVGETAAVDDLMRYLDESDFTCEFVLAVGGLIVDAPITLADGVTLRPYNRALFLAGDAAIASWPDVGGQALDAISAAFVLTASHPKQHVANDAPFDAAHRVAVRIEDAAWERLRRARACVALAVPSPSYEVGNAIIVDRAVPCAHTSSARSWFTEHHCGAVRGVHGALVELAQMTHRQFVRLPPKEQARLLLPMHRLERALHPRADLVDVAIDLGIALEATLLGGDAGGELTYRLSMRGACLVGTSTEDRRLRQRQLSALYTLRSKAVHTGSLPTKPPQHGASTNYELLASGMQLAAEIIRTLIARGGKVDWDEVILGPPSAPAD